MLNASEILSASEEFSFYYTTIILVIGSIGNLLNFCVFTTSKSFRSNQCAFYLIVESIVDTCQLFILFITDLLPMIYGFDPENVFLAWCKLKNILLQILRLISTSMVCFAAIDQFLSTNPQTSIRQMSKSQLSHRLTFVAICLWILHSIPFAIFYQIVPPSDCAITNVGLIDYYSFFYYPILHGLLPIFASSLFSVLAYRNVRHLVRRQINVVRRRLDRQLTAMIFARVISFVLLLLPYTVYRIYELNTAVTPANPYLYAINQLLYSIMMGVTDLNCIVRFLLEFPVKFNKIYCFR